MMIKSVMVGAAVAVALASFGASAANQGQGVINFKGSVIDAPCGIAPESADQSIDFGQLSKAHLEASGVSVKKDLDIKLVNCDAAALTGTGGAGKGKSSVKVSFTGATVSGQTKELGTAGDTGTAIVISEATSNTLVSFDGTAGSLTKLKPNDNVLRYSAWVKKATGGTLKEGDFSAVANFNLTYE